MKNDYLKLFESCRVVKGNNRSVICDLQKNRFEFIPNSLAELFDNSRILDLHKAKKVISKNDIMTFNNYINFLLSHEFGFQCSKDEIENFPDISLDFDYPAHLSNAIIDYDKNSNHDFLLILNKFLIPSLCRNVQFRFYDKIPLAYLMGIIKIVESSFIKTIDIVMKYNCEEEFGKISDMVNLNRKIRSLILHSAIENNVIQPESNGRGFIATIKEKIHSSAHCGTVHNNYFTSNIEAFTESISFNSCLNKKIAVDIEGNIKNCPSMLESYGNIRNTSFKEISIESGFKKYWDITKDQIEICKDCEFRYICRDCRAYTDRNSFSEDGIDLSKPLKCGYDPYTNKWEEWSENPLKLKSIKYYGMQDMVNNDA